MSKLYVGNLSSECNENALRQLFQDHNLSCTTILVKRGGYAFVDCADQSTADRAIDKLNDYSTKGQK
ncbi:insulin-like growth factor 2 mRNA-binding protein 2 [Vespula maculifrons]|uniref:Insulin-like growth factor 2 mRNA-binding protein 2 n=1 Tax=Vespula maculifrons TaxID=7453 RepID=A0ABD2ATV8_VESMC